MIASAMAALISNAMLPSIRADGQARRLVALIQYAREVAIASRRNVRLQFNVATRTATLTRMDAGLGTPLESLVFEFELRYQLMGLPDTPELYGADTATDFGDSQNLLFEPDGSFIDETGLPINGTIFLGISNQLQTARAITITGTTARPRLYRWSGADPGGQWIGQ